MKKMNKKGFTIVELVIVIAVIAILAGVLIPTFSGIVEKAQISAEQQKVTNAYKEAYATALVECNGAITDGKTATAGGFTFTFTVDGTGKITGVEDANGTSGYSYTYDATTTAWTVTKP